MQEWKSRLFYVSSTKARKRSQPNNALPSSGLYLRDVISINDMQPSNWIRVVLRVYGDLLSCRAGQAYRHLTPSRPLNVFRFLRVLALHFFHIQYDLVVLIDFAFPTPDLDCCGLPRAGDCLD